MMVDAARSVNRRLTNGALGQLHGTEAQECNGVEGDVNAVGVVGEGDQAVDTVSEGGDLCLCDEVKMLPHNLLDGFEGQPHNGGLLITCCCGEHHEHGLPARLDIAHSRKHHLRHTSARHQTGCWHQAYLNGLETWPRSLWVHLGFKAWTLDAKQPPLMLHFAHCPASVWLGVWDGNTRQEKVQCLVVVKLA